VVKEPREVEKRLVDQPITFEILVFDDYRVVFFTQCQGVDATTVFRSRVKLSLDNSTTKHVLKVFLEKFLQITLCRKL
jgi:hypothetical protein